MIEYNKLVRDRVPNIIHANGEIPVTHIAGDEEYAQKLAEKLREEVDELLTPGSDQAEELADVLEVVLAIAYNSGLTKQELDRIRTNKAAKKGTFQKRIILERVE